MSVQVKGSGTIGGLDEGLVVSGIVTSSTQVNVGSNIKLGSAGVVTATSFIGSGANLTSLPSQLTLSNNADNRVITGGSGTNLVGEATLTFTNSGSAGSLNLKRTTSTDQETIFYYSSSNLEIETREATGIKLKTNKSDRVNITATGQVQLPVNGQQLTWGASQQMKFYYENSEDRMYLQGDGAYGFAFRINSGNRIEIDKTTGDVTMQGASGRNFQWDNSDASLYLTDSGSGASARLKIGSGQDLQLYHDVGGANHITCATNQELKISANKHTFYDYSGVTKRMEINASGQVTQPSQPSFAAYRNQSDYTVNAGDKFEFNTTRHNVGNHYSTSNHRFTAPISGSYQINFYTIYRGNVSSAYVRLYKNGARMNGGDIHFTNTSLGSNWDNVSFSQVVYLSVGDYLEMYNGNSGNIVYHGNHWQLFSGWLLG